MISDIKLSEKCMRNNNKICDIQKKVSEIQYNTIQSSEYDQESTLALRMHVSAFLWTR